MRFRITSLTIISVLFFANCDQASSNSQQQDIDYIQKGKSIASSTFTTLSASLQKAMKEGGVPNAIKYCNQAASPIVDSLSQVYNANIRRTSLKVRNPKNSPNDLELVQLENYQKNWKAGKELKPVIQEIDSETIAFYAPISVMPLCQKCHGKVGETLKEADYKTILQHYPEDKAVGFSNGDLRGMWSISFKK